MVQEIGDCVLALVAVDLEAHVLAASHLAGIRAQNVAAYPMLLTRLGTAQAGVEALLLIEAGAVV